MPSVGYVFAVLAIGFVITLSLRALPFAVLEPLRESAFVAAMARWMPAGILGILAAVTFLDAATVEGGLAPVLKAVLAVAVTVATHLLGGRRTLVSVGAGTLTYVLLVNFL